MSLHLKRAAAEHAVCNEVMAGDIRLEKVKVALAVGRLGLRRARWAAESSNLLRLNSQR